MRVYPIKQNTKTEKEAAEVVLQLSKTVFLLGTVIHCAANNGCARTCDCSTNGKWKLCETGGGTANCLAIQVFFPELFFEET
jgi:hypothetical protein